MNGTLSMSGSGGVAIGSWGFGASGAGGVVGGLEMVIVSTNKRAFLGSSWSGLQPKPAKEINSAIYGTEADLKAILAVPGGRYEPATSIRTTLTKMVVRSWETESKSPQPPASQTSSQQTN